MDCRFEVNGFEVNAHYSDTSVRRIFLPMLETLTLCRRKRGGRLIAFLAAPPAVGKSTLAVFLEHLSAHTPGIEPVQALGMDGFHFHQDYIETHTVLRDGRETPMRSVKGAPESFDLEKLTATLNRARREDVMWPFYDRRLHDVVEEHIPVSGGVLLIEGNWLLLDEPGWRDLACDYSLFIGADEDRLRPRLIRRKIQGGLSRSAAEAFYEACDGPNIRRCMARRRRADVNLRMTGDGSFEIAPPGMG